MGFLDKVKAQAEQTLKQGQDKLDEVQAKRKADALLRDLGAWYYAVQTDRDDGQGAGELARITAELKAHEAEHGPLGGHDDEAVPVQDPPPAAAPPPSAAAPPPPAPPAEGPPGTTPPAPGPGPVPGPPEAP